ncbi:hypothetical protein B0A49_09692 [Cryomyces minteri]|uniref:Laccase-2 n=1 Tax=Cryomyces minteri TaxID=331657 RepID=A0A4U0WHR3_9PEZI|nr:hypothetical protein B0A49_09692 [Cryomyces minteri]
MSVFARMAKAAALAGAAIDGGNPQNGPRGAWSGPSSGGVGHAVSTVGGWSGQGPPSNMGFPGNSAGGFPGAAGRPGFAKAPDFYSPLGTSHAPQLPDFLTSNPLPDGKPWGTKNASNTNVYVDPPTTNVTRTYNFVVTKENIAPDGVNVTGLLINGQFPGPTIEANWGDWIEVTVHNNIPDEGTAFHWHGFLQKDTQYFDGVPGTGMCPIAPGSSLTYRFKADLYGTSWYHAHYSAQSASGMIAPMVIHGPTTVPYDIDVGPIMIGDWYHMYYEDGVDMVMTALPNWKPPRSNNNLINGKNNYDCSLASLPCTPNAGIATFNLTSGKSHRLRFINPSANAIEKISIDGHTMTVIANDFVPIMPYNTTVITLGVGQRADVIVHANGKPTDSVWMRALIPDNCSPTDGKGNYAQAAIFYENADRSKEPTSQAQKGWDNNNCANDDLALNVPWYPIAAGNPSTTETLTVRMGSNGTHLLWYQNDRTFRTNYNDPLLLEAKLGNLNFPELANVHNYGTNASVRFFVQNHSGQPHPMHMHGHNMFILAQGVGWWDGTIVNPENPTRRDVQIMPIGGYIVVQWNQDNPGVWPFHCHTAWHLSQGMVWNVLENPQAIKDNLNPPPAIAQTCRDWAAWSGNNVVDQIDSGL